MILKLLLIALGWTVFIHIRKHGLGPKMPLPAWICTPRLTLQKRIKSKDVPILCEGHSKNLVRGDMALIDHKRCQKCFPPSPQHWPPPMPPSYPFKVKPKKPA